ncbi:MAG: hypothetical protein ACRDSO_20490, partial [Pseudonocardiaceae bacterium]
MTAIRFEIRVTGTAGNPYFTPQGGAAPAALAPNGGRSPCSGDCGQRAVHVGSVHVVVGYRADQIGS